MPQSPSERVKKRRKEVSSTAGYLFFLFGNQIWIGSGVSMQFEILYFLNSASMRERTSAKVIPLLGWVYR
jgi:hypothetical protein